MSKQLVPVDTFRSQGTLDSILRLGREKTRFLVRPTAKHNPHSHRQIVYAETPYSRFIAADKWLESDEVTWDAACLADFMDEMGPEYKYHTPAAFAMSLYRKLQPEYIRLNQDGFRSRMAHASLYGGRCEVLQFGTFTAHQYDINSSYPYAATAIYFPDPRALHVVKPCIDNILKYEGVSRVTFSQSHWLPVLPIRFDDRVYYVQTDHYGAYYKGIETTYTHLELRHALEHGAIIHSVERQYIAETATLKPFDRFVQYCFDMRESTGRRIWKVIANSLIGRLAVTPEPMLQFRPAVDHADMAGYPAERIGFYGLWCVADEVRPVTDSNPLWAAMVLACARCRLHNVTLRSHAVYIDTDCVFSLWPRTVYPLSSNLGAFKESSGEYEIKGAKLYSKTSNDVTILKMKGVSKLHRGQDTYDRARYTSERFMYPDGSTRPYELEGGTLV